MSCHAWNDGSAAKGSSCSLAFLTEAQMALLLATIAFLSCFFSLALVFGFLPMVHFVLVCSDQVATSLYITSWASPPSSSYFWNKSDRLFTTNIWQSNSSLLLSTTRVMMTRVTLILTCPGLPKHAPRVHIVHSAITNTRVPHPTHTPPHCCRHKAVYNKHTLRMRRNPRGEKESIHWKTDRISFSSPSKM